MLRPQFGSALVAKMNNDTLTTPLLNRAHRCLVCYNNNKTKRITCTLSLICRAEYSIFVNHMIANTFSNTQGILLAGYTCIHLVL